MFKLCRLVERQYVNNKLFNDFVKKYRPNYKRIGSLYYLSQRCWNTFDKFIEESTKIEQQYQIELELSIFRERMHLEQAWKLKW
jgi:hypothetical protein